MNMKKVPEVHTRCVAKSCQKLKSLEAGKLKSVEVAFTKDTTKHSRIKARGDERLGGNELS